MTRARDVPLPAATAVSRLAGELTRTPNVENRQRGIVHTAHELVARDVHGSLGQRAYAPTTSSSAAIDGRSASRASHSRRAGNGSSETPITSRARITQGT